MSVSTLLGEPHTAVEWIKNHKIISTIIALFIVGIFGHALGGKTTAASSANQSANIITQATSAASSATQAPTTTTLAPTTTTVAVAGIGQVAKDGDFAFVVKGVQCGASAAAAVSDGGFGETVPSGAQECLVTMTVTNDKGSAQTFFTGNQYAYDSAGHKLSADSTGSIFLSGANDDAQINPGVTITAIVPFQISTSDKITSVDLHDSMFSLGVKVDV
jgi:hypothetical protein